MEKVEELNGKPIEGGRRNRKSIIVNEAERFLKQNQNAKKNKVYGEQTDNLMVSSNK